MSLLPAIPEPLRMLASNPNILDFSANGPIPYVLRQKLTSLPMKPTPHSLESKTVLVTGATSGVGQEAARQFLACGANVILGVRDTSKGEVVKRDLLGYHPEGEVDVLELDLESFASVDTFVGKLKSRHSYLDIAVMNAGLFSRSLGISSDGYDVLLQVNFLSTAYLSLLLLPLLRTGSSPGRLVLVSSEAHCWTTYSEANPLDMFKSFASPDFGPDENRYYVAKLFIALFGRELASRVDISSLAVTTTTPGFCASGLFRDTEGVISWLINLTSARSVQHGGRLHIHAATVSAFEAHGQYFRDGHTARLSNFAESKEGQILGRHILEETINLAKERGAEVNL